MPVQAMPRPQVQHSEDPQADTKAVRVCQLCDPQRFSRNNPQDVCQACGLNVDNEMGSVPAQLRLPEINQANTTLVNELTYGQLAAAIYAADVPIGNGLLPVAEIRKLVLRGLQRVGYEAVRESNAREQEVSDSRYYRCLGQAYLFLRRNDINPITGEPFGARR
jgi:hypothetical protein